VLYREALAMGLDKDDTIVKRRMAQKMQFLAEDVAAAHEPTTDELKAWFEKHSDKFALPSRATFRHLYFSFDRRGQRARDDALAALARLGSQPEDSRLATSLADPFMFQDYYGDRTSEQLAKEFGPTFAQGVFHLQPGSWQGPIESGYGWHLVWIESIVPGRVPDFEEVEPDVKTAWLDDQKEQAWRKAYEAMRAKYAVLLPAPPDKDSTPAPAPAPRPRKEIPAPSGEGAL
jgi:peptidyl-prolyl cis-trans isomerase C